MPQRFLRPGLTTSDRWNAVSFEAQSFFVRILTLVDDFGRYDGRVLILHGQAFALRIDITPQQTAALRDELHQSGLIQVYAVEGKDYIQVARWQERARCEKSKYPDPANPQDSAADGSGPQEKDASLAITSSPLHHRHKSLSEAKASSPHKSGAGRNGKVLNSPTQQEISGVVETYHRLCPSLPRVQRMGGKRLAATKARWREAGEEAAQWFERLFRLAGESNRVREGSWCSFDWLMSPSNSLKVLEGHYANGRNAAQAKPARRFDNP